MRRGVAGRVGADVTVQHRMLQREGEGEGLVWKGGRKGGRMRDDHGYQLHCLDNKTMASVTLIIMSDLEEVKLFS